MGNRQEKIKSIFCLFKKYRAWRKICKWKTTRKKIRKKNDKKNEVKFSSNQKKMCFNLNPVGLNVWNGNLMLKFVGVSMFHIHR